MSQIAKITCMEILLLFAYLYKGEKEKEKEERKKKKQINNPLSALYRLAFNNDLRL